MQKSETNKEVINMVNCPYCNIHMIDSQLICKDCVPLATIDMAVHDIQTALSLLQVNKEYLTQERKDNIDVVLKAFHALLKN